MKIIIETIPHNKQRYNTCGDWQYTKEGDLRVKVSEMKTIHGVVMSHVMESVIGLHEVIEALSCSHDGITEEQVDKFDTDPLIEEDIEGLGIEEGDHPNAPYKQQHTLATGIERILCYTLGIPWYEYENQLIKLTEGYKKK